MTATVPSLPSARPRLLRPLFILSILTTTLLNLTTTTPASSQPTLTAPTTTAAQIADLASCPKLRIAVVNGVAYHYEVIAGLLYVLRPYASRTDVFLNRFTRSPSADGAWDILRRFRFNYQLLTPSFLASLAARQPAYDLVILVSHDYELDANEELLRHVRRRLTVAVVHNSDFNDTQRLIAVAGGVVGADGWTDLNARSSGSSGGRGGEVRLLTLSPHTATSLSAATGRQVGWQLPVYPYKPHRNCLTASEVDLMGHCLRGFSIQGKFSNLRRNYSAIWSQLTAQLPALTSGPAAPLFHVNILGKGVHERLALPPALAPHISLHKRLAFRAYYEVIHHTFALLPAFASARYFTDKFSSTVLTSLIAGTPLVADERFLVAYGMFDRESVYLQAAGEAEVDVMLRVLRMRGEEVLAVRRGLVGVRRGLNERASGFYTGLFQELCGTGGGER